MTNIIYLLDNTDTRYLCCPLALPVGRVIIKIIQIFLN